MAVRTKTKKSEPIHEQIPQAIAKAIDELYRQHSGEISECLEEAEDNKLRIAFATEIDCSESEPVVTTSIRFSTSVTDRRICRLDDPNQISLHLDRSEIEKNPEQTDTGSGQEGAEQD